MMCIKRALQLAQTIIEELVEFGFKIELVKTDSLYGDHPFVGYNELDFYLPTRVLECL